MSATPQPEKGGRLTSSWKKASGIIRATVTADRKRITTGNKVLNLWPESSLAHASDAEMIW